jgi:hypothetical protein
MNEIDERRPEGRGDSPGCLRHRGLVSNVRCARHQAGLDASGPGAGSVSPAATDYGRRHRITVIDGGRPLMFGPTADLGHKLMRLVYAGHVPKQV